MSVPGTVANGPKIDTAFDIVTASRYVPAATLIVASALAASIAFWIDV
jgi:hypothetical protein